MKFIKIGLKILLPLFLIMITMSFIIENVVIKTFSQEILSKKVSGYFLDKVIQEVDITDLGKMEKNIRNSKYVDKITSKFIQTIIQNIVNSQNKKLDIEEEVNLVILENMPKEIDDEKVENTKEYVIRKIIDTEKKLEENFLYAFGDWYLIIFKLYSVFTNSYLRIAILTACFANIIGLVLLEKYQSLKIISKSILIVSIFTAIMFILIKVLSKVIDQKLAGGWISHINLSFMSAFLLIELIIGMGLWIISKNREKNESKHSLHY